MSLFHTYNVQLEGMKCFISHAVIPLLHPLHVYIILHGNKTRATH